MSDQKQADILIFNPTIFTVFYRKAGISEVSIVVKCTSERWSYGGVSSTLCSVLYSIEQCACEWHRGSRHNMLAVACAQCACAPYPGSGQWVGRVVTSRVCLQCKTLAQVSEPCRIQPVRNSGPSRFARQTIPFISIIIILLDTILVNTEEEQVSMVPEKYNCCLVKAQPWLVLFENNYLSYKECGFVREYNQALLCINFCYRLSMSIL